MDSEVIQADRDLRTAIFGVIVNELDKPFDGHRAASMILALANGEGVK